MRIHGGPVASETIPGGPIAPLKSVRGLLDIAVEVGLNDSRWEGPQSRELIRRLKRAQVTVLLANYGPTGVALLPVCSALGIPLVVHFHGRDAHMESIVGEHAEAYRQLGRDAAALVAVSGVMREALISLGIPAEKISILRCGVDEEKFFRKAKLLGDPLFFGVGRFVDKKAPYLTLLAFKTVLERCPEAKLVLAGDGPLWETTCNFASALGIAESVKFPGIISPEEVAESMQRAFAFVQHSITPQRGPDAGDSEGTPVAVIEALISGVAVIATRHAGIGEVVIDQETGFLVEERDVQGMALEMIRLATDPHLAMKMGDAARRDALGKYTANQYIYQLRNVLESCV
ncbi:MAG: glycosyltransferase [Verrucomicrobiales bacterium]|nr:glycosyltransferase [Verrucomicrobiales bacterium]